MIRLIAQFLSGGGLGAIERTLDKITEHKRAMRAAELEEDKLDHEERVKQLDAHLQILLEAEKNILTAWIRPAFAAVILVWFAKVLIWDQALGLGATPEPAGITEWIVGAVIAFYFATRPFEKYLGSKR